MHVCDAGQAISQSGAPLHVIVQSPSPQLVILQVCAAWQVSWHPPAGQSTVHDPPVQSWMQSPPGQLSAHVAPEAHSY